MWLVNVGYLKVIVVMVTDRNHSHKLKIIIAMSSERRRLLSPRRYPAAGTRSSIQDGFSYEEGSDSDDDVFDHADKRLLYASANPSVISVASFSELFENEWNRRRSGNDSDEEDPPLETIYRRSCKDKTKLLILAPLYFILMVIAAVIAFYSIETVIVSYQHRVRTVQYITVDEYHTIGIALFPQNFAKFNRCEFLYGDDLAPHKHNWSVIQPPYQACNYTHVTFRSRLVNQNRTAVIFHGPTLVKWKQSLAIHFRIDTTVREFSAIEYLLLEEWHTKMNESPDVQADYLAEMEYTMPLFTLPAGFRSWVKMAYVIRNDGPGSKNLSDFVITSDFATYTGWYNSDSKNNSAPIYALFEWKTNTYEYFTEILSTTIWNTVGSLTGVFVALMKAGEYCQKLVQRIRRDRKKKQLKLKELEEERQKKVSEHQRKQRSKLLREGSPLEDVTA